MVILLMFNGMAMQAAYYGRNSSNTTRTGDPGGKAIATGQSIYDA